MKINVRGLEQKQKLEVVLAIINGHSQPLAHKPVDELISKSIDVSKLSYSAPDVDLTFFDTFHNLEEITQCHRPTTTPLYCSDKYTIYLNNSSGIFDISSHLNKSNREVIESTFRKLHDLEFLNGRITFDTVKPNPPEKMTVEVGENVFKIDEAKDMFKRISDIQPLQNKEDQQKLLNFQKELNFQIRTFDMYDENLKYYTTEMLCQEIFNSLDDPKGDHSSHMGAHPQIDGMDYIVV